LIAGIGTADPVIHPPTPPRTSSEASSSTTYLVATVNHVSATPSTSAPQSASSAPAPTFTKRHMTPTPPVSAPSSLVATAGASSQHHPLAPSRTALGPISHNIPTSSPKKSPKSTRPRQSPSIFTGGTGTCQMASHICPLSNCIFLLGPCISTVPWITQDLLHWHGCRYMTSVRTLSHPSLQRRCSRTGKRFRKIALVESNRTQPTVDFLKQIGGLGLMRKGKKEWVEVYDWRLLECITKVDQGKQLSFNPWDRCWIGAI
jgi:hypothetical protein